MRPNSICVLIIQLFDLVSNCNSGGGRAHKYSLADLYQQRQHTGDIFSLSSLNKEADLWPVGVFALETPDQGAANTKLQRKQAQVMGVFSYLRTTV